jgi:dipeptidyl aminopeptidase/acylaminoacyl peptidase
LTGANGGPSMVRQNTNPVRNYPILSLVEAGYVVLIPNSRGRGGYGEKFDHAIRDERSYVTHPVQDVLAGVDSMVARGIADSHSLGIFGFSYGEILAMTAVIQSSRFKAAIVGGGASDLLLQEYDVSNENWPLLRDMYGLRSAYDREEINRSFEQTVIFFLDRVHTPVLIESGEKDNYVERQRLYRGLLHFGIPVEHNFYPRSGHGYDEPLLLQDSYRRHISWFDYWLRNKPYRDPERQKVYDVWKDERSRLQ